MIVVSLSISYMYNTDIKSLRNTTISLLSKKRKSIKQKHFFIKYLRCLFEITAISYTMSNFKNTITTHFAKKLHRQQPVT